MSKFLNYRWRAAVLVAACLAMVMSLTGRPHASSSGVVISQVYGGGGNSGATWKNDFIELFNSSNQPVDISGWSVQYASTAGSSWTNKTIIVARTILQPGRYYLIQEAAGAGGTTPLPTPDATGNIAMAAGAGKVALVRNSTSLTGACPTGPNIEDFVGYGTGTTCYEGSGPTATLTNSTSAFRTNACIDGNNNASDFSIATLPNPHNSASPFVRCPGWGGPTDPTGIGAANPPSLLAGNQTLLTVAVTPGTLPTSSGLAVTADLTSIGGTPGTQFYDDGTHGDATAGDQTFSYRVLVTAGTSDGSKTLAAAITDLEGRTGTASIAVTVEPPPPPVLAIHEIQGAGDVSPYAGSRVETGGIVTGVKSNGFFMQAQENTYDADPQTSEGIFVYTGGTPTNTVGDLVEVVGKVQEYARMTEISGPTVTLTSSGNLLPAAVTVTATDMAVVDGVSGLEKYEGMRVVVDSPLTVVGPTDYGIFYGVFPGVARPFREPGIDPSAPSIPEMPAGVPRFDGNPERLGVDGGAIGTHVIEVTANATVSNIRGPLDYSSGTYFVDADATPTFTGNMSAVAVPAAADGQFTVASWNMLDFINTDTRMSKASQVIRNVMRMPDIIGVEEVNNPTTLKALADRINSDAGSASPGYVAQMVGDTGTQNVGFLVKSSVTVGSVTEVGRDATFVDPRDGSVDPLNDRPPLVLRGSIADPRGGPGFPITVVVNHLRSMIDVDTYGDQAGKGTYARIKRQLGAEYLANLLQQYQENGEHVVSVGDYNAFQFNDGYVDVIGTVVGQPAPADQVLLASADLVNPNFTDLIDFASAAERYSYVENGNAQDIDHIIVSPNMLPRVAGLAFGRDNADFPYDWGTDATRPERASDHDPAVAYFTFPTADLSVKASAAPPSPVLSGSTLTYTIAVTNGAADDAVGVTMTATLPAGVSGVNLSATPTGWTCDATPGPTSTTVSCTAAVLKAYSDATFTIGGTIDCLLLGGALSSEVKVEAVTYDPDTTNNTGTIVTTVSNPPPSITGESSSPVALWPVNHKFVPVTIAYSVADNCGPAPVCSLTVSSNERTDGRGDGRTATDWQVVDEHSVLLRAERAGTGNGRTYTIGITCTDAAGNAGTRNVFVTVPKSQK